MTTTPDSTRAIPAKIAPLTSLRFFAALGVVIFHMQASVIPMRSIGQFALGVSFFFVLSGFILAVAYPDMSRTSLARFYVSRFARLWPVHALCWAAFVWLYGTSMLTNETWMPKIFTNLAMLQAWIPTQVYVFSGNSVSWSISAEMGFYLLFPMLAGSRHPGKVAITIGILIAIGIFQLQFFGIKFDEQDPFAFSGASLILQSPFVRVFEFAVGVWAGRVFMGGRLQRAVSSAPNLAEGMAIILLLVFGLGVNHVGQWLGDTGNVGYMIWWCQSGGALFFALLIFVFAHARGKVSHVLSWKPLVFLGEASFALYMVHQIIIKYSVIQGWHKLLPWWQTTAIMLAVIFGTTLAVFLLWEKPMRWLILRVYDGVMKGFRFVLGRSLAV